MADPTDPNDPANPNDPNQFGAPYPGDLPPEGYAEGEIEGLESGTPEVAASPRRAFLILVLMLAGVGFILYLLFGGEEEAIDNTPKQAVVASPEPALALPEDVPPLPQALPAIPPVEAPPPLPEPAIVAPATPEPTDEDRLARLKSNMLIINAEQRGGDQGARTRAQAALAGTDPNTAFQQNAIAASEAERAEAKRIEGDLNTTIVQGKIIDAVLETAINTDLPGTLRAIISRDIFPESGRLVVIPKGSRLIGQYNTGILRGQRRVFIIWTRVIRPDGIDVAIDSPGIDNLGRAGIEGFVDNKYMEIFSGAVLTSALSIGAAVGADKALGDDNRVQTTTNTDGSITQSGTAGAIATAEAVSNAGTIAKGVISGMLDVRPTITVDQGTKVNVFVNRDLTFPPDITRRARVVP